MICQLNHIPLIIKEVQLLVGISIISTLKALIILTHGYTINGYGGKSLMLPHAKYLFDAGYSVFLWDIPGFGESSGDSITLGITEWKSAAKVYEYVRHLQNNLSLSIGFMGISMGATTIINTVGITNKGDFIIAVVPYATLTSLATQILHSTFPELKYVPFFVDIIFKLKFGFDYANYLPQITIENISVPILIMYAENDSIVNPQDAKELYAKAHSPKEVWSIASNHFIYYAYPNEFSQTVLDFLSKYINNE